MMNDRTMTFKEMIKNYPELEDELSILRNNITTKGFYSMLIALMFGIGLGLFTMWVTYVK